MLTVRFASWTELDIDKTDETNREKEKRRQQKAISYFITVYENDFSLGFL